MVIDAYLGFGQLVSGGGLDVTPIRVGKLDELTEAIEDANKATGPTVIVVTDSISADKEKIYELSGTQLTIYGNPGTSLDGIGFVVTERADDIIFRNLTFSSVSKDDDEPYPDDTIVFCTTRAPGGAGFLVDHCAFGPVPDMSVQTEPTGPGAEWLRLSVAYCLFDGDTDLEDQGSIEISGYDDEDEKGCLYDVKASVLRCYFKGPRRRSPRSSRGTFVHAYNNVVRNWGAEGDGQQSNGMAAGAGGRLAVIGNYFDAGEVKATVDARPAIGDDPPGWVQLGYELTDTNMYEDDACPLYRNLEIDEQYVGLDAPVPLAMTTTLADTIMGEAGAKLPDWGSE